MRFRMGDNRSGIISDHSINKYVIGPGIGQWKTDNIQNTHYITNKKSLAKFQGNVLQIVMTQLGKNHDTETEELDEIFSCIVTGELDIEKRIDELSEVIKLACNKSFPNHGATKKITAHKSVPWWAQEMTVLRKRTNGQRRLYQRTRINDDLREKRKNNTPKVKQNTQQQSKGKELDPGKSTAT